MVSVPTSLGEWIHSPWFDLGLVVWKGYRPRVRLVLAGGHASAWFSPFWRGPAPGAQRYQAKRKYTDPTGQTSTQQLDPTGNYSVRDLQKLNATFAGRSEPQSPSMPVHTTSKVTMWRHGEVPPLGPATEGRARAAKQLAYARTLLTFVIEAATQMEEVVGNLVQIEHEQATAKEEELVQAVSAAPTESCTDPATEGSQT